jgi:PKD repeat protein
MKNILSIILFILFSVTQSFSQNENAISNQILVRMQIDQNPHSIIKNIPTHFELSVERNLSKYADIWLLEFNDEQTNLDEVLSLLTKEATILYVQPNRKVELRTAPNDPLYNSQWHHDNIDSELAWDITTGGTTVNGKEIVVALIESADLINHSDLQDNHWKNTAEIPNNGIDDDGNGYIDDYNGWNVSTNNDNIGQGGHGTSCAGMMGAKGNNDSGVSGVNWDLKIMDIAGYGNPFTEANIVEAYDYALKARVLWNQTNGSSGAFVVATSASWGVDGGNPANFPIWCSFYDDLGQEGILNVGATTNQNQDVDIFGDVPTACASDYMIGVTATNSSDVIDFAGYGDQTINLAAPGSSIFTTGPNNSYVTTSGTSFACPLTAGVIGLMYSIPCSNLESMAYSNPSGTADIVRQALYDGVDQSAHLQARTISGGRVNVKNSIDILMGDICSSCLPPNFITTETVSDYDASISFHESDSASNYRVNIQVEGSGNWSNYTISDTNYIFTGLTSCTSYAYYVSSICDGIIGSSSEIQLFTTTGCGNCIALNYCGTGTNPNPASTLTVHSPLSMSGSYTYQATSNFGGNVESGYVYGELVLADDGSASPNEGCIAFNNLAAINGNIAIVERGSCNFTIKAMNAQNAGATAIIVINNAPGTMEMGGSNNNVTIPAIMISQSDGNTLIASINNGDQPQALLGIQNEWIEEFQIDGNTFTSGDNNGYIFEDNSFVLNAGQNYPFTLIPGYDGQALDEYYRIWIDLDQNGVFDVSELIYDQGTAGTGAINNNFTIPANTTLGKTRMRIQMAYQGYGSGALPNVCGDFTSGEVEDYCIEIRTGTPCNMNVNSTAIDPTCNELQNGSILLNVSGGTPGYSYSWNNGMNNASINSLNTNNYSVIITDGSGCDTTVNFSLNYATQLSLNESITYPTCPNENDGSISVNATGGNSFIYQWNNGPNANTWINISAGSYQVTATDNDGCKITSSYLVVAPSVNLPVANFTADNFYLMIEFSNNSQNAISYEWDFDDGNTSTDFEPNHTYINEGIYNVCLTAYGLCDTTVNCNTITVEKNNVGLNEEMLSLGIKIYPNPASDIITIEKESDNISKAIIYAANGKIIDEIELSSVSTQISIQNWNSGIYFLHFVNKNNEFLFTKRLSVLK